VLIFPEGTRSPDGEIKPFKSGFTTLATRTKAAILPVAVDGAYRAWPKREKLPKPGNALVRYGKPILPRETAGLSDRQLVAEVERRVRECQAWLRRHPLLRVARPQTSGFREPG
jgi:1-acyl-sn-glycerol-3-phosphate acyltransferase